MRGTLVYPGIAGGSNWGGVAVDPVRRIAVLNATNLAFEVRLIPRADFDRSAPAGAPLLGEFAPQLGTPFGMLREPLLSPLLLPCTPPPWGTLTAHLARQRPRSSGRAPRHACRIASRSRCRGDGSACRTSAVRS